MGRSYRRRPKRLGRKRLAIRKALGLSQTEDGKGVELGALPIRGEMHMEMGQS